MYIDRTTYVHAYTDIVLGQITSSRSKVKVSYFIWKYMYLCSQISLPSAWIVTKLTPLALHIKFCLQIEAGGQRWRSQGHTYENTVKFHRFSCSMYIPDNYSTKQNVRISFISIFLLITFSRQNIPCSYTQTTSYSIFSFLIIQMKLRHELVCVTDTTGTRAFVTDKTRRSRENNGN